MNFYLSNIIPNSLWVIGLLFFSCSEPNSEDQIPDRPNIVIILADDQGWGDLSMNGNPIVQTPHIDGIAAKGVTLDYFYVNSVCSPTRAALLTGRYAVRGGVYSTSAGGERLDLDEESFATVLKNEGYKTGAFGKWHNGMQYPYHPNARGFEEFVGYCSGHWGSYMDAMLEHNGKLIQTEGYLTDVLTDKAIDFIEEHASTPFLVYLPLNTPHSPMQVPDKWWNKFADKAIPTHRYSDREKPDHTRAAYAMAENIDWNVGRVVDKLAELNIEDNTLLIYFSDNGPNGWRWSGGMEGIKGSTNEGGVRSPFVAQWPNKISPGLNIEEVTQVHDLFPTLLELIGSNYDPRRALDGRSLAPLLLQEEEGVAWEERALVSHWRGKTSVRNNTFRLDSDNHLFHMKADFAQEVNVADSFPAVFDRLKEVKDRWEREVLPELPSEDLRSFPLGHPDFAYTQLPARDGVAHGNIQRSNRWPNCSFYTNWISVNDSLSWEVEVLSPGMYEVELLYTCKSENVGVKMELKSSRTHLSSTIDKAFDPPLRGMEFDRFERGESYVKDWATHSMGKISLESGMQTLVLKATEIPGEEAIDFRLLMIKRVE